MSTSATITTLSLPNVRKALRAAGLESAKVDVSKNVRKTHGMGGNYSTVRAAGFKLANETEYRRKQHVRTGRVEMHWMGRSWNPDEAATEQAMQTAEQALRATGWDVQRNGTAARPRAAARGRRAGGIRRVRAAGGCTATSRGTTRSGRGVSIGAELSRRRAPTRRARPCGGS
jgi:hypothetical protein